MLKINGVSNLRLTVKQEKGGITILRVLSCDRNIEIPDELLGLPVTSIGQHAFEPNFEAPAGEEIQIIGIPTEEEVNNRKIESISLPASIRELNSFAFHNCFGLKKISLHDSIDYFGASIFLNCTELHQIDITEGANNGSALFNILEEVQQELTVRISGQEQTAMLFFPGYYEYYVDNNPALEIFYYIEGTGYSYHHSYFEHCFTYPAYDELWRRYSHEYQGTDYALKIAWYRLRYPVGLTFRPRRAYRNYLADHLLDLIRWRMKEKDTDGLKLILETFDPDQDTLQAVADQARQLEQTQMMALILEELHRKFPPAAKRSFDL